MDKERTGHTKERFQCYEVKGEEGSWPTTKVVGEQCIGETLNSVVSGVSFDKALTYSNILLGTRAMVRSAEVQYASIVHSGTVDMLRGEHVHEVPEIPEVPGFRPPAQHPGAFLSALIENSLLVFYPTTTQNGMDRSSHRSIKLSIHNI